MNTNEYFETLEEGFKKAYDVAAAAKSVGFDPKTYVEIKSAPDLAGRVEALMNVDGLGKLVREQQHGKTRSELAFAIVKSICTNSEFEGLETMKRIELATRTGLAIATEGVLVAPTEGIQSITRCRNSDNSDYIAVSYAGPIRSAGGTTVALSVAFADYARQFFSISAYKATPEEVERYVEEIELYHAIVRLQYKPSPNEIREIVRNCGVCIDGVSTEDREVSVHANIARRLYDSKQTIITNRVRGGVALVISSIAQKAKSVQKEVRKVSMDWSWLSKTVTVEKTKTGAKTEKEDTFLEELVAGRPILSYPSHFGGFRLRYGRSRFTGISAKGFNPATMIIADSFIGVGTQLKIETPGKGCVAMPVDTIEGPFVVLKSGEALRIDDVNVAILLKNEVERIVCLGDMLITYGDFRKNNSILQQSSYVEEFWQVQIASAGESAKIDHGKLTFKDAYSLSLKFGVPIHPKFLFEFLGVRAEDLERVALAIPAAVLEKGNVFDVAELRLAFEKELKNTLERMNVPHKIDGNSIVIAKESAQSLLASLGFAEGESGTLKPADMQQFRSIASPLEIVNKLAPFKLMKRSTFIGARIGRPEKARERLMKPAPNILFPISSYGGSSRNLSNAYSYDAKRFGKEVMKVELARHRCKLCGLSLDTPYCYSCKAKAEVERTCPKCGLKQEEKKCIKCGSETLAYDERPIDFSNLIANATSKLGMMSMPSGVKGVRGLINKDKIPEPLEKGILRSQHGVFVFKDGTARFDATNAPLTHFYPKEMGVSVEKLRKMGYDKDFEGKELKNEDQLVEMRHQDIVINRNGAIYLLKVSQFMDDMLEKLYGIEPYYKMSDPEDLVGQLVLTLSPHTSCAVLNRIIGLTDASVGFVHPFTLCARRRDADGDEDTVMLLLDALINFSKEYLPSTIGGTMDEPLLITTKVDPTEIDDQAHTLEVVSSYPLEFYEKTIANSPPGEAKLELVENRLGTPSVFENLLFTHLSSVNSLTHAPKRSMYTQLKTMQEKIDAEFRLMDILDAIEKKDAAKRLIMSHFIPDLIGNLHSFSRQRFRCSSCNAKYRRVPLSGKCNKDGGKLLLTISKGGIEKYLITATDLANRYDLDPYTKQRIKLIKDEIASTFNSVVEVDAVAGQFDLSKFI